MKIYIDYNAEFFLENCRDELEKNEAEHNLILGLTNHALNGKYPDIKLMRIYDEQDKFVMVAVQTPPHNLLLSCHDRYDALPFLITALQENNWSFSGVLSRTDFAEAFAKLWSKVIDCNYKSIMCSLVYELENVITPRECLGFMRFADMSDVSLIAKWAKEFSIKVLPEQDRKSEEQMSSHEDRVKPLIEDKKIVLWCLDDNTIVAMAGVTRETRNVACVSYVYTPLQYRGNGYASTLVAKLSSHHLEDGKEFCCLYTDASNKTSNHIYQAIGYNYIAEHSNFVFN